MLIACAVTPVFNVLTVISWPRGKGSRSANCVRCFFRDAVARDAARYALDFGVVPRFRGGLP